ncbi:zinc finger, CCHC-type containing protein [Tanacetum coccineum]
MDAAAMKHMASSFAKLEKFEMRMENVETSKELWDTLEAKYMAEDASSKKFLVSNFTNYKMTYSRPVLEQYNELLDFKHTLKHLKEELTLIELGSHLRIEESLRAQDNDKPKGNNVVGPSVVNMVEHNNSSRYNDNKGKRKHHDTRANPNKKPKVTCWKCGKPGHLKKDCKAGNVGNRANGSGTKGSEDGSSNPLKGQNMFNKSPQIYYVTYVSEAFFVQDDKVAWWVDSGATVHVCKDRCWFKTYESLNDGSILHMENESTALVHGRGCVDLKFSFGKVISLLNVLHVPNIWKNLVSSSVLNNYGYKQLIESNKFVLSKHGMFIGFGYLSNHRFRLNIVSDNIGSAFMSTSELNDSILWHARLDHVHFKRMQDMSKDGLIPAFDMDTEKFCYVYLLHSKDEALDKFKVFKTETELQQGSLIKRFKTDRVGEYIDTLYFQSIGIIHETTAPYTLQQNSISESKNRVLKEMVNSMLFYSGLSQGFWGESMLTACYLLNRVPNKRNKITPYELWTKRKPNLNYLRVWGCREIVRLLDPKLKTLGERSIECIFVGYAEHSKAFRFYVIEPNNLVAINSIIKSRDAIFDEHRFSSVPRPSQRSLVKGTEDSGGSVVSEKVTDEIDQQSEPKLRKNKRHGTPKDFGPEFQLYLIEGTMDKVSDQYSYCFNVEDDPKIFDEAMKSQDVAFWKEAINDEMDSIMGNNTWVLTSKFDASGKGVIICLYVDDMLIFGTDQVQVDLTKEFLSSRFSMKDMGDADVILGIKIKHESNGIAISQSYYIEKVLKKFNYSDCTPVSTPMDTCEKQMPNKGQAVSQLEYSRVIGCLMYAMTCTIPDIAFVMGKLSMYTCNPDTQYWQAIQRVLKYLKKTMNYRLKYSGYPSVLEGYNDASWIIKTEDNSSTSGWVFLLGGAISWASKMQTCITGSTMESEFVALAAAGKEAEWLKNLLLEIPLWIKPMAPISIRCDSAATLAKAYSQMYNGKSRHLGVRHSMIRELITTGVVSIEFVRSQQNLVDHLMKVLARDLVIKSVEGMGLKSNEVVIMLGSPYSLQRNSWHLSSMWKAEHSEG